MIRLSPSFQFSLLSVKFSFFQTILFFFLFACSTHSFTTLSTRNPEPNHPFRLTTRFSFPKTFQAVSFQPVRFFWPNGKEEKVWNTKEFFSAANSYDLKDLVEGGFESSFGNVIFESNGNGNLFAVSPIQVLVADESAIAGEFAFYFRTESGGVCKQRLSLFFKGDSSNNTLRWVLSKGLAYQGVYFANRCLDSSFVIPDQAKIEYSFLERPWEFLKTKVTGSYEPFTVSFLESFDLAIEKLPKEMKYTECVQYGNTASGGVRCVYSQERTVRDIDWKGHTKEEKDFRWDWVLDEK